jgi:hypothetical protein
MMMWKNNNNSVVFWGNRNPFDSKLIAFSNFPWRDDKPCAGIWIVRAKDSEAMLREWWDYDLPEKNEKNFMEQDALWYMLEADPSLGFIVNQNTTSLIDERQFPSAWNGLNDLWLAHIPSYLWRNRIVYFRNMLRMVGLYEFHAYAAAARHVKKHCQISVDILAIAEAMERRHVGPRRTAYPRHRKGESAEDAAWHAPPSTRSLKPDVAKNLEGLAISVPPAREIWIVQNGSRRAFPNMDTMQKMGFSLDLCLQYFKWDPENTIPIGPPLSSLS